MKYIKTIFRQVEPSPNNHAVNSLAKDIQQRNVRKLKINANVTFSIWILEWIAFISCMICWVIASNTKIDIFLEFVVLWNYVILPHTYLMNTAHNKDRIIDQGLKSTIINALKLPFDMKKAKNFFPKVLGGCCRTQESVSDVPKDAEIPKVSPKSKRSKVEMNKTTMPSIFTVTNNTLSGRNDETAVNVEDLESLNLPSTSNGVRESNERKLAQILQQTNSESEQDFDKNSLNQENRIEIGMKLLTYMNENVNDEKIYLHYLLQLADYERSLKEIKDNKKIFHIAIIGDQDLRNPRNFQQSKNQQKKSIHSKNYRKKTKSKIRQNIPLMEKAQTNNALQERVTIVAKRKVLLETFNDYCQNDETYESFLTILLDFEENLLNS